MSSNDGDPFSATQASSPRGQHFDCAARPQLEMSEQRMLRARGSRHISITIQSCDPNNTSI